MDKDKSDYTEMLAVLTATIKKLFEELENRFPVNTKEYCLDLVFGTIKEAWK